MQKKENIFNKELLFLMIAYCWKGDYQVRLKQNEIRDICSCINTSEDSGIKYFRNPSLVTDKICKKFFENISVFKETGTNDESLKPFLLRLKELFTYNSYEDFKCEYIFENEFTKDDLDIAMEEWINKKLILNDFQSQVYIQFQDRYFNIQKHFSSDINSFEWYPTKEEKRYIELYWYFVFDEWILCHKNPNLLKLWDNIYKFGVISSFSYKAFKDTIISMFEKGLQFRGYALDFKAELTKLGLFLPA